MALWSLLGPRPVTMLAWESFGAGWVTDVAQAAQARSRGPHRRIMARSADLDGIDPASDVVFTWNGTTSGVRVPERRLDRRRPHRPDHLRRDLGRLRPAHRLDEDRCRHLQLAEGARRRRRARHARAEPTRGRAAGAGAGQPAASQDLPPDQRRRADRRRVQGRDDQHALDARGRGLALRARLGGADRRARRARSPAPMPMLPRSTAGSRRPTGSSTSPAIPQSARTPRFACSSPTARTERRTRRGRRRS